MKKIINYLLILACSIGIIGCNKCNHDYELINSLDPTTTADGYKEYQCSNCIETYQDKIPLLSKDNYTVTSSRATCEKDGYDYYNSEKYGSYTVKTKDKLLHTSYGGFCMECEEYINNFEFTFETIINVYGSGGYPRLYELNDGTWLCGFDSGGKIWVVASHNQGQTWESNLTQASFHNDYTCANVAFYQFENGDLLCAYRAIGKSYDPYGRYIHCSISKDNGKSFQYHSTIEDNYALGFSREHVDSTIQSYSNIGFYEPHFGIINNELTVMYADDFSPMAENVHGDKNLNYQSQYLISRVWDGTNWVNRKIIMNGAIQKTVGGITEISRDGMPVFDQMHNGTYVVVFEGTYRRADANGRRQFEILLSYSKDGETWSNPIEVYVPNQFGSKASAPYVCVTSDDRLVISFQTDEDSIAAGKGIGDNVSIMKTMISDGTPIEELTKYNFYDAQNVFLTEPGKLSAWNGMMMKDDVIYCVSGTNTGIKINSCPVPKLIDVASYNDKEIGNNNELNLIEGSIVSLESTWMKAKENNNFATLKNTDLDKGTITTNIIPAHSKNAGIIFKYDSSINSYYYFYIDEYGMLYLSKYEDNVESVLDSSNFLLEYECYKKFNQYDFEVVFEDGFITCSILGDEVFVVEDSSIDGNEVGIKATGPTALFKNLKVK